MRRYLPAGQSPDTARRGFIAGLGRAGVALGLGPAATMLRAQGTHATPPRELRGTEFDLEIAQTPVNITGQARIATAVNGQVPAPTLYWREGDTVTLRVTNRLPVTTSIHWHGLILPADMGGVAREVPATAAGAGR